MLRSMYSAISGLLNHSTKMDVIGNDISNVNTVAYKESTTQFTDAFSQVSRTASTATPIGLEVGLGSNVVGTKRNFNQGAFQRTDVPTDVAIGGDGWFFARGGTTATEPQYFTRAGNFVLDQDRFLRTAAGQYILGVGVLQTATSGATSAFTSQNGFVPATITDLEGTNHQYFTSSSLQASFPNTTSAGQLAPIRIPQFITELTTITDSRVVDFSIATDGAVTVVGSEGGQVTIGYVSLSRFNNNEGLMFAFNSLFEESAASGANSIVQPSKGGAGTTQSGTLELANVDLATEFTDMIVTQRGFDANARTISTADEMLQTVVNIKR